MMKHILKTDPAVFQAVADGAKTYEIRLNDRGFAVGDELLLRETTHTGAEIALGAALEYTGREITKHIGHVLGGYGLQDGWVILSFAERTTAPVSLTDEGIIAYAAEIFDFKPHKQGEEQKAKWITFARALLAAAPAPIQQAPQATLICPTCGKDRFKEPCPNMADECPMIADAHLLAPPALAGSQVQGDEVNEREAFEAMVKERFVTTEHSLARAHPYGYYNTVSSDTFGGRRQPDYANVQMLWDVWDARATIAKKAMLEQP